MIRQIWYACFDRYIGVSKEKKNFIKVKEV